MKTNKRLDSLRDSIRKFRDDRERVKEESEALKDETQPFLIAMLKEIGAAEDGLVFDEGHPKGTAFVQQNSGSTVWDEEKILDWLSKPVKGRRELLRKSQSLVFDINKFEALVGSKEIPPKTAAKFQKKMPDPAAFIRFGKKGKDSL